MGPIHGTGKQNNGNEHEKEAATLNDLHNMGNNGSVADTPVVPANTT